MINTIFFDFDGTLFSHTTSSIPESTIKALKELKQNNIKIILCTGRTPEEMELFDLKGIEFDGYVLSNGQKILDKDRNIIKEINIEGELKEKIIELFNSKKMTIFISTNNDAFMNFHNNKLFEVSQHINGLVAKIKEYEGEKIYTASIFMEDEEDERIVNNLSDIAEISWWYEGAVDIGPKGINKVSGIDEILKHFNIDIKGTMALGDGQNDIGMLKHCSIGVCMDNGCEEAKREADYITDDINNDGVYEALKHFDLI